MTTQLMWVAKWWWRGDGQDDDTIDVGAKGQSAQAASELAELGNIAPPPNLKTVDIRGAMNTDSVRDMLQLNELESVIGGSCATKPCTAVDRSTIEAAIDWLITVTGAGTPQARGRPWVGDSWQTIPLRVGGTELIAVDTAGCRAERDSWRSSVTGADAVVLVIDSSDALRLPVARHELWKLEGVLRDMPGPFLVLANKQATGVERSVHAAVWQGSAIPGDTKANLQTVSRAVRAAADQGVELVLFPELFLSGRKISRLGILKRFLDCLGSSDEYDQKWFDRPEVRAYLAKELPNIEAGAPGALRPWQLCLLANEGLAERAFAVLAFLTHGWVWGEEPIVSRLPRKLAVPLAAVADIVGRPPILTYFSFNAANWQRVDMARGVELGNTQRALNFLGGRDEEWFSAVHVAIEAQAGEALLAVVRLQRILAADGPPAAATPEEGATPARTVAALQEGAMQLVRNELRIVGGSLAAMTATLRRMKEHCDPYIYYMRVRLFMSGWTHEALPHGMEYERVPSCARDAGKVLVRGVTWRVAAQVLPTRALENHLFVLYANLEGAARCVAEQNVPSFCGRSCLLAPDGEEILRGGGHIGGGLLSAVLRLDAYAASVKRNPYLADCDARLADGHYSTVYPPPSPPSNPSALPAPAHSALPAGPDVAESERTRVAAAFLTGLHGRDFPYGALHEAQRLRLYLPEEADRRLSTAGRLPVAFLVHGGFWKSKWGSENTQSASLVPDFLCRGFAVALVEYRRREMPGGGWPGTEQDVMDALGFLRELEVRGEPLDLERVVVIGHSAGGQLALVTCGRAWASPDGRAAQGDCASSSPAHAVRPCLCVAIAATPDMMQAHEAGLSDEGDAVERYMGCLPDSATNREKYAAASAQQYLPLRGPTLLVSGTEDTDVPPALLADFHALALRAAAEAARGERGPGDPLPPPVELLSVLGADHYQLVTAGSRAWRHVARRTTQMLQEHCGWLLAPQPADYSVTRERGFLPERDPPLSILEPSSDGGVANIPPSSSTTAHPESHLPVLSAVEADCFARWEACVARLPGLLCIGQQSSEELQEVCRLARDTGTCIALPYAERDSRGALFNACALFDASGRLALNYRKVNLWGPWEQATFARGTPEHLRGAPLALRSGLTVRCGVIICYDVEFPEPARCLARQGVELLLVPTALGAGDVEAVTPFKVLVCEVTWRVAAQVLVRGVTWRVAAQ
eukprot:gene8388-9967_t